MNALLLVSLLVMYGHASGVGLANVKDNAALTRIDGERVRDTSVNEEGSNKLRSAALSGSKRSKIEGAIRDRNEQFMRAFARADALAIGELYAEDAQLLQPNGKPILGRPSIAAFWKGAIDAGLTRIELRSIELYDLANRAAEVGEYEIATKNAVVERGKYIVIWKRTNGVWRLHRDIWNTDTPPASQ